MLSRAQVRLHSGQVEANINKVDVKYLAEAAEVNAVVRTRKTVAGRPIFADQLLQQQPLG